MTEKPKYIVVLGTSVSGLGKGLIAASIAANLDWLGYTVKYLKLDGYLNIDPGTMAPTEHGECFVTADGLEADMDLGHFERFTSQDTNRKSSLTSGIVYDKVLKKEREGLYLGKTVQVLPHITSEIISNIRDTNCDFKIVEVGGTVGDIESDHFLEAIRQLKRKEKVAIVELVYVPYLACSKEWKTKLAQTAVSLTRSKGLDPDVLLARSRDKLPQSILNKIERFTDVPTFLAEDLDNVYKIPLNLWERGVTAKILSEFGLDIPNTHTEKQIVWSERINRKTTGSIVVGIAGKYENGEESYKSIVEALYHAGTEKNVKVNIRYLGEETTDLNINDIDGIIVPGGFGVRGNEEKIQWLNYTRENNIPTLGICLGMQLMCVEYARNALGIKDSYSEEWGKRNGTPIITYMPNQNKSQKGGTMRLGKIRSHVFEGLIRDIYGEQWISERHRHRLEFMVSTYREYFSNGNLKVGATSSTDDVDDRLIESVYLPDHPFFVGVQFHPELSSRFLTPHPLFIKFIESCLGSTNSDK